MLTGAELDWPFFALRLRVGDLVLRHVREADLPLLADLQPDDYEHDPGAALLPGEDLAALRRRLVYQGYWRSVGTWSPDDWCLDFLVEHDGAAVGVQSLEASSFRSLRTVDSGSWLIPAARGQGGGVAMRAAVLSLAFDHLGALAAVTSARRDNAASLGVSRRLGYVDNGVSLNASGSGLTELAHLRLTRKTWVAAGLGAAIEVSGVEACSALFA